MRAKVKFWTKSEDKTIIENHRKMPRADIAALIGRTDAQVRGRITILGIGKPKIYPPDFVSEITKAYQTAQEAGFLNIKEIAERYGINPANISRKAKLMGFATTRKRKRVAITKAEILEQGKEERHKKFLENRKTIWQRLPHPKGMLGKKHTEEVKKIVGEKSRMIYALKSEEEKSKIIMKSLHTRIKRHGMINGPDKKRGNWKAGWREVGGKRNYYRSLWEANYARYLQMLKEHGQIKEWQHEPKTFWFEKIMRGVRSYKPDFLVTLQNGLQEWHEVKGWLCPRSKTTLARMAKYYPNETIILIDSKRYKAIRETAMRIVFGWEDSPRDRRM